MKLEKAQVIVKVESYVGCDTALDATVFGTGGEIKSDSMWVVVHVEDGEVNNDLTDYGYHSKEEAVKTAQYNADEYGKVIA